MSPRKLSVSFVNSLRHHRHLSFRDGRFTACFMMISLLICSLPAPVAASTLRETVARARVITTDAEVAIAGWFAFAFTQRRAAPQPPVEGRGVTPPAALSKFEKEANVAEIKIDPAADVVLQSRQPLLFAAIPVDREGVTIHGLSPQWESSNRQIVFVNKNGEAVAGKPGTAILTATAGSVKESVRVTVVEGTKEKFGGKKTENSRRARQVGKNSAKSVENAKSSAAKQRRAHTASAPPARVSRHAPPNPLPFLRDPLDDPLPDDETGSLYSPANNVGTPPGKTRPGGLTPSVAVVGTETGNKNFAFGLPIVNLQGRGVNVSLDLTYNSLLYNKSIDPFDSSVQLTYDVDSGYPAPGFHLGYGQIEDQGSFGFTLTDGDGTRHSLTQTSTNNYDANDGTFIHFTGGSGWGTLFYPDGTQVTYGAAGGGIRSYPTKITDTNGNYILITYVNGVGPRISSIKDTMERYVRFYYATNGDLTSVTAPGLGTQADREMMRFIYQDISFSPATLFSSTVSTNLPSSAHVIKYIYLASSVESANAHLGYRFDYSSYGMIYQSVLLRGMTLNAGGTAVTTEGTQAAITTYNYPGTPVNTTTGISDVPVFSTRTDDWAGRTTGMNGNPAVAPFYSFSFDETTGVGVVTAPNGATTETHTIVNVGQWNNGLVNETFVDKVGSASLSHTVVTWEQGAGGSPRISQVQVTDDAGQTKSMVYNYAATYNNVSAVIERGFANEELRRTETTYITSASYINRHLIHLPETVKIFAGGATTPIARTDYAYDNYGTNHASLTSRAQIVMHDPSYDPFAPNEESCNWECTGFDENGQCIWEWVCNEFNPYDPSTDFRGNVTSITDYPDANSTSNTIVRATTYDIAGNVMSAQVACCNLKSFSYTDTPDSHTYAYQTSETRGDPSGLHLTTNVAYDFNTGVVANATDENGQVTTNFYNGGSLRLEHIDSPDGGATFVTYSDTLEADANGKLHYFVQTQIKIDAPGGTPRYNTSRRYFDGRDAVARTFENFTTADGYETQDIEYDVMGLVYRNSSPYFASSYSSAINPSGFWTTNTFDHLGRSTLITMPRGDDNNTLTTTAQASYSGVFMTVTDQAGKQRRQKVDALGRVIRVDEPDSSGSLGATGTPVLATSYEYDVLNNLVHVSQPGPNSVTQHRYFKYDSLSRLTRERQVEQTVNASYNLADSLTGNSSWTRKVEYNSTGLVSDVYDARGIRTQISYDILNRVTNVNYFDSTPDVQYFYDSQTLPTGAPSYAHGFANGRMIAMTYGGGAAGSYYGYDSAGRVNVHKQVTGSAVYSLAYTYNFAGLITTENYPTGRTLNFGYDEGARLTNVNDGTTNFTTAVSYVAHGGLKSETWGNGAVHSRLYNRRLQTSEVKLKQSSTGTELQRFNYSYGQVNQADGTVDTSKNLGQLGRVDSFINGAGTKEWDQRFVYDELGRLSTAAEYQQGNNSIKTWQTQYTYDRWGNRFQSGSGNSGVLYTPVITTDIDGATNRFITTGATPTTYDASGNILTDTKFRSMNYTYDANGRTLTAARIDQTMSETSVYDCSGRRVQTISNGVTRTMVYDIFGQNVADYTGSAGNVLERESIYRGGQLLSVIEVGGISAAAPSGLSASLSGANIALSWSAASGATNYRVEKKTATAGYTLVGTTASTSLTDTGVTSGSAYLYKVCAANAQGACVSTFSNLALGTTITFATDPTITTIAQDPSGATVTPVKAAHITELRTAVNTVRGLAGLAAASWTNAVAVGSTIKKEDVTDLRVKLDEALTTLSIQTSAYTDSTLAGAPNGTVIKGVHITQLRQRVQSGVGAAGSGGGVCYKTLSQFVKDFFQGVLKRQPNSTELQQNTDLLAQAQLQGQAQLIGAAQNLGTALFTSSEYTAPPGTSNAQYVTDLYNGYLQRTYDQSGYDFWLGLLNGGETRANVRQGFALSTEFRNNVKALCIPSSTGNGVKYVLPDAAGSTRALMNSSGVGTSSVVSRHDFLPFGEEIWAGTGLRSSAQGYNVWDQVRSKYGKLERDENTGLDHTWWREYENTSGRWTAPDPYDGSMTVANPQSFNRYTYVQNDPVNLTDSTGLFWFIDFGSCQTIAYVTINFDTHRQQTFEVQLCNVFWVGPIDQGDRGPRGGGGPGRQRRTQKPAQEKKKCDAKLTGNAEVDLATRYIFAESTNDYAEMVAIGQVGTNRYDANEARFGGQDWEKVWDRLSIANETDPKKTKHPWNRGAPDNLANLDPNECQKYKDAQRAAQRAVNARGNPDAVSFLLPGVYWFLGRGAKTQGLVIGATTFYTSDPNPANRPKSKKK